ncbi:MAG: sulfatase-like hydrolase/transferase, partial [Planctomycetota bacterium]
MAERPNVLVILVDDMGYSDASFMGGETPTPNIDELAKGGLRFTQCYNSARCCPSRAMLVSGLYPHQTGIGSFASANPRTNRGPAYVGRLNNQCVTFGEVLGASGYQTYMVGKWHMEAPGPIARGFDEFYGYVKGYEQDQWEPSRYKRLPEGRRPELAFDDKSFYATDAFTEYSLEFLRQARTKDKPWLLYLAHSSPHFPVQAPKETVDRFIDQYRRGWDILRGERFERMKEIGLADESWKLTERSIVPVDRDDIANGYPGQPNPAWDSLPEDRREDLARRGAIAAAMMHHVDEGIGRLVADLKANDELDNTLILFMSDNGACYEWGPFGFDGASRRGNTKLHTGDELASMGGPGTYHSYGSAWANLGNTPFQLYKHFCHEGGNCTPLVAHWPAGIKDPDRWVRDPVALMDVMPTLCEVSGAVYPDEFDGNVITPVSGKSLKPIFAGANVIEPRLIFAEHQKARSVRRGQWKAVWSKRMPKEIAWELYDIQADRCETMDLAQEHPDIVKELEAEWIAWAKKVHAEPYIGASVVPDANGKPARGKRTNQDQAAASPAKSPQGQPFIKKVELTIEAKFKTDSPASSGVIVCHGGNQHGYSIYLDKGNLIFAVRRKGKLTTTEPLAIKEDSASFKATLDGDGKMELVVEGRPVRLANAGGLIDVQPVDLLSIGFDDRTSAAAYKAPNRFAGSVTNVTINGVSYGESGVSKERPKKAIEPDPKASLLRSMRKPIALHQFEDVPGAVAKPFFADPFYNGSCDPEIVWNDVEELWFIYYTARRSQRKKGTYVGTPLGVISSPDLQRWTFRGYCSFDGVKGRPDSGDTHWAPGVIVDGEKLHMFATYKDNANPPWGGNGVIRHYVAPLSNPIDGWKLVGIPNFNQPDPIDVSLIKVDDHFRAYYRVGKGGGLQWAISKDLKAWDNQGKCLGDVNDSHRGFGYQEAPYVFKFNDAYWMLTDPHDGLAVFRSDDGITWDQKQRILKEDGEGPRDTTRARHPSVAVVDGKAYIFYHVEPNRPYPNPPAEERTVEQKISFLQIAELTTDGDQLACDRNEPVIRDNSAVGRWSNEKANQWYKSIDWPIGANFVPSTAVNQLEMWQAETFDPETIDRELGWAASIGMNSMRVFLHDIAWSDDPEGFLDRVDQYLSIADKHGIRTMIVLFDGVWNPLPKSGAQPQPAPRVHNSGWIQSPGREILDDPKRQDALKPYVVALLDRFKDDPRVLLWDLFNEPENSNAGNYGGDSQTPDLPKGLKRQRALELLQKTFAWAREVNPSQPLTAGVWGGPNWLENPDLIETCSLTQSDVITFHTYNGPADTRRMIEGLKKYDRPIMCTEYLARGNGSTFEKILPILQASKIGAYNWGLVDGKTNTIYPWDSWKQKYEAEPKRWHHDVFRRDGTPYRPSETKLIARLTGRSKRGQASFRATSKRPNIVFILTDDQGWTGLNIPMDKSRADSRSDFYRTPNVARLASSGMRFSRGYSPAPNCSPSRYANLTGKTCARLSFTDIVGRGHGMDLKGQQKLNPGGKGTRQIRDIDVTIPELLKTLPANYRTAHFGKWHLG